MFKKTAENPKFSARTMNPNLNSNVTQLMGTQPHYNVMNNGHYTQMGNLQPQRPSFGIHEILGLSAPSCRQNPSPDILDNLGITSPATGNGAMYGLNNGTVNGQYIAEPNYQNIFREHSLQQQNPSFYPWKYEPVNQIPSNPLITNNQAVNRYSDTNGYGVKAPILEEGED